MIARRVVDPSFTPALGRHARSRHDPVRGCLVILGPERVLMPDAMAAAVLSRCDGTRTIAAIAIELAALHGEEATTVERDVLTLLQGLTDDGWIRG